ncbi:MAG: hypothetical protein Tsb0021_06090 [Chlamydiales bacterium]
MTLENLVENLSNELGIKLHLNEYEMCHVHINEEHVVTIESSYDEEHFFLYAPIAVVGDNDFALIFDAMTGNLFGLETGSASIGYDPRSHALVLFQKIHQQENPTVFISTFKQFINTLDYWKKKVENFPLSHEKYPTLRPIQGSQQLKIYMA